MSEKLDIQLYSAIFDTWRFQVNSYWQRTSYFAAFETATLAGEWNLLNSPHVITAAGLAALGILLTAAWFLNNQRTHNYVLYWWGALADIERKGGSIVDFVSSYEIKRKKTCDLIPYHCQIQFIPILFGCAWIWLLAMTLARCAFLLCAASRFGN